MLKKMRGSCVGLVGSVGEDGEAALVEKESTILLGPGVALSVRPHTAPFRNAS